MIGVLCRAGEQDSVQEFFELFKTPWEFFTERKNYGVIVSTLAEIPRVNAGLIILYSSVPTRFDAREGTAVAPAGTRQIIVDYEGAVPIYGNLARLAGTGRPLLRSRSGTEVFALGFSLPGGYILRVGYDLFAEVAFLLSEGQPAENALIPTLELHILLLRDWIVNAGFPLVEIPPTPWGHRFMACLTHDVDFGGIRWHKFDHTMWGFVHRALVGSLFELIRGDRSVIRLLKNWTAVLSLPLVYLGMIKDFWDQFERYIEIEKDLRSTFFLIPFKDRVGENVQDRFRNRRATCYDIRDVQEQVENLTNQGFEIGLHGIDAWHNAEIGVQEKERIMQVTRQKEIGVRIHWLCFDSNSHSILEEAGFDYDSTCGYNEAIGYKAGTMQVFRPLGVTKLLELPLHIQDTALFYPRRMALTHARAWELCGTVLNTAARLGGVVTVLWHDRSLAPERLWDRFYVRLLDDLSARGAWFGSARQVIRWFRQRRSLTYEACRLAGNMLYLQLKHSGPESDGCLFFRVHLPRRAGSVGSQAEQEHIDVQWHGEDSVTIPLS